MIEKVKKQVQNLLGTDETGHNFDHILRVYNTAEQILATEPKADKTVVLLAALLHDVDDYKLFGVQKEQELGNAKAIMQQCKVEAKTQEKVIKILQCIGYHKALEGIRPKTIEGKIVSDADMLDAIGANGIVRCLHYAFARCATVVFDKKVWPNVNMSAKTYKQDGRKTDNFINHFFEKMLKVQGLMMTKWGKKDAKLRQKIMIDFLTQFFREQNLPEWQEYLQGYLSTFCKKKNS